MDHWRIGRVLFPAFAAALLAAGCRVDAIATSNTRIDFERWTGTREFAVWNTHPEIGELEIEVAPTVTWIQVAPRRLKSAAPVNGREDRQNITVAVDRSQLLTAGTHKGRIELRARGVKTLSVGVSVIRDHPLSSGGLEIARPAVTYSKPYLIEFSFALRNREGRSVVGEPGQFGLTATEEDRQVGPETGLLMRRGAARQLWLEMALDYSLVMQQIPDAIAEMEYAATEILLPSLNADALAAVSAFHRDDRDPALVAPFNVDRAYTAERIRAIQSEFVRGFSSGARLYDAVLAAVRRFHEDTAGPANERYLVLFANGRDTSSRATLAQALTEAIARKVRIFAIGFGATMDTETLMTLAAMTGGRYFPAESIEELRQVFQRIVEDLEGQYIARWASLRRDNNPITPAIRITFGTSSAGYVAEQRFRATDWAGDPLAGRLQLAQSETPRGTTVFLRADYVPRNIRQFRCWVQSSAQYDITTVPYVDDGLMHAWSLHVEPDMGGLWITATSPDAPLPFAAFGPLLRFDFAGTVEAPFTEFQIDNSIYEAGQTFQLP